MANKIHDEILKRQSRVQKEGEAWENIVMDFCNKRLKGTDIEVVKGNSIAKNSELWEELAIPVGEKSEKIWGDIDLVAINKSSNKPIAVISCKISLHGRFSETLFYAVVLKDMLDYLKVAFATPDKGRQPRSGVWISEWGTEEKPTKDRLLGSHYLDGVYIQNKETKLGGKIKALDDLPKDLLKWNEEIMRKT